MSSLKRRNIRQALLTKGFVQREGSNHDVFTYHGPSEAVETLTSISTALPRGSSYREIGFPFLKNLSNQLKLTNQQFRLFVKCPLDADEYAEHLAKKGLIQLPVDKPLKREVIQDDLELSRIEERIKELIRSECDDYVVYELMGKVENKSFRRSDLDALIDLEETHL